MAGTRYEQFLKVKNGLAKRNNARAGFCLSIFALILVATVFLAAPARAEASSAHGPFTSGTDKCSSCHRIHVAQGDKLITQQTPTELCLSCHAKGQSADTAVLAGVYLDAQNAGHGWGVDNGILLGGGFNYVGQSQPVTGKHTLGLTAAPYGTTTDQVLNLGCLNCHTPHQGPNYRLLRQRPGDAASDISVTWNGPWTDATQTTQGGDYAAYTVTDFNAGVAGVQGYTKNYQGGLAEWCSACHDKYTTRHDLSDYNAGDTYGAKPRFRHAVDTVITNGQADPVNGIVYDLKTALPLQGATGNGSSGTMMCLTCHAAHGSAASMTGSAALSTANRGSLPGGENGMMLREDDRAVCSSCHNYSTSN
jgi:predicted CXXCH cytochrome family protein